MAAVEKTNGPITPGESVKAAREELKKAMEAGENILTLPDEVCNIPPMHIVTVRRVPVSPDPADNEVYVQEGDKDDPPEKKKYTLRKEPLLTIAHAGNVQLRHEFCGMTAHERDSQGNVVYMAWKMVGVRLNLDGSQSSWQGEADFDFKIIEDQILEGKRKSASYWKQDWWKKKSAQEKDEHIKKIAHQDYLNFRRHAAARCETAALLRLIHGFFPMIKGVYSYQKLQKPFVVARLVFRPDYADEYVRRQAIDQAFRAVAGIFGPPSQPVFPRQLPGSSIEMQPNDSGGYEMPEAERAERPEADEPEQWGETEPDPPEVARNDFQAADVKGKIQMISALIDRKGWDRKKLTRPMTPENYTEKALTTFFESLLAMQDATAKADDDIPP